MSSDTFARLFTMQDAQRIGRVVFFYLKSMTYQNKPGRKKSQDFENLATFFSFHPVENSVETDYLVVFTSSTTTYSARACNCLEYE